ncbi:MAG: long-chain-acyl-CoA synthetase, partial [Blastocatellia bacterium]|nr:long-chain-acyl-CoA synthetase [Blastocatellia bacterium]
MHEDAKLSTISVAKGWMRAMEMTATITKNPARTLPAVIEELAQVQPDAPALLSDGGCLSYQMLCRRSHEYARWARREGLVAGDTVCVMMHNCPEYVAIWLGLTRVGVVVSLINVNLTGASLAHCIKIVRPRLILIQPELVDAFKSARPFLDTNLEVWSKGDCGYEARNINEELASSSKNFVAADECPHATINDQALYIYTSGTSGLPKAAKISHSRLMQWSHWFAGMMDIRSTDRMYNCLPMYHSIGGVVAVAPLLIKGGSVVVREKFSATRFWDDIVQLDCTVFQYIGELCRYLVNSKPHPNEAEHRIRLCCGNGLRPDVWDRFKARFNIHQILEFYAATEGNVSLFNLEGKPGSIGRTPRFLAHRFPTKIVKIDIETGEVLRGADGFCILCRSNEIGEAIGKIDNKSSNVGNRFEGYNSDAESERKMLRDAIEQGDVWFRTGDLMRQDEHGYFYFVDRIGDTFRWKGENVATTELSETITAMPGVREAVAYGVPIPGHEGRAGMAALVVDPDFDLATFRRCLAERLPRYARPLFIRICQQIETTTTFK